MRKIISHLEPDRFVSGTIGQPGERVFFIQVKSGNNITSVIVEKSQVAILAERIDTLLNQIMQENDNDAQVPEKYDANVLRVHIDAKQGRLFAERGRRLVSAGRQPCPFCNEPLGQRGHICARANGYKR